MQAGFLKRPNKAESNTLPATVPEQALVRPAVQEPPPPAPPAQEVPGGVATLDQQQQQEQEQQQQQQEEEEEEEHHSSTTGDVLNSDNWRACLQLLASTTDEEKFVGLLLATKLLPHGSDQAVQQVVEAVSLTFLQRLLLPLLQQPQGAPAAPAGEQRQQQYLCCTLALSILSAACHIPAVAGSPGFVELLPPLLKVVASGGAAAALGLPAGEEGAADDSSSWLDAVQCSTAAAAMSEAGRMTAVSSQAVPAATAALHKALEGLCSSSSSSDTHHVAQAALAVQASVRLLAALLQGPPIERHQLVQRYPQQLVAAVVDCASVFGQRLATSNGTTTSSSSKGPDAASLQLDTLHLLLLLLPPPAGSSMAAALQQCSSSSNGRGGWAQGLQAGLLQLLVGRVGAVQRLSALQLAAALVEVLGPHWLMCTPASSSSSSSHPAHTAIQAQTPAGAGASGGGTGAAALLRPLVEVLCVEMPLLLSDAMSPDAVVPALSPATAAAGQWAAPAPKYPGTADGHAQDTHQQQLQLDDESQPAAMDEDQQQQEATAAAAGARVLEALDEALDAASAAEPAAAAAAAARDGPQSAATKGHESCSPAGAGSASAAGGTMLAGERAAALLPACYQLLEAVLELLVASEAAEDGSGLSTQEGGLQAVLSAADAGHLMRRVQELAQVLQDFLAYMSGPQGPGRRAAAGDLLVLGAVRCLGRLWSEAPDAAGEQAAALLPFMLQVQPPGAADDGSSASCMGGGVSFLLLALVLWTSTSSSSSIAPAASALRQLRRSPEAGAALLRYVAAISQQAVALSATALRGAAGNPQQQAAGALEAGAAAAAHMELLSVAEDPAGGASKLGLGHGVQQAAVELGGAEGLLAMACEVVAALLGRETEQMLLVRQRWCGDTGGSAGEHINDGAATAEHCAACAAAWTAAADALCAWAAARHQQQQQQQQALPNAASRCTTPGDVAAVGVVSSCAAVFLQPCTALLVGQLLALLVAGERMGQRTTAPPLATPSSATISAAVVWALELGWSAMLVCLRDGAPSSAPGDQQWQEVLEVAGVTSSQLEMLEECWDGCCEAAVLLLQVDPSLQALLLQAKWLQPALAAARTAVPSETGHKRGRLQGLDTAGSWSNETLAHAVWQQSLHLQLLVRALL